MNFEPTFIKRADVSQRRPTIRRTPTDNRELARQHEALVYRKVNRRGLAISLFAFFATVFTLLWFILIYSPVGESGAEPPAAAAPPQETAAAKEIDPADIPAPDEIAAPAGFAEATGRPVAPDSEEYREFYFAGEQVSNWFGSYKPDRVMWTGHH